MGIPDLSENLIDEWVRSGLRRLNSEAAWPWTKQIATPTVPALGSLEDGYTIPRCRRIITVTYSVQGELRQLEIGEALRLWPSINYPGDRPRVYTISQVSDGQRIRLWPGSDDDAYEVTVQYYEWPPEWPLEWSAPTEMIPVDAAAHEAVMLWALNRALLREEQQAQASTVRAMYHQQVTKLRESLVVLPAGFRMGSDDRL